METKEVCNWTEGWLWAAWWVLGSKQGPLNHGVSLHPVNRSPPCHVLPLFLSASLSLVLLSSLLLWRPASLASVRFQRPRPVPQAPAAVLCFLPSSPVISWHIQCHALSSTGTVLKEGLSSV